MENMTIKQGWESFKNRVLKDYTDEQIEKIRDLFYTGATVGASAVASHNYKDSNGRSSVPPTIMMELLEFALEGMKERAEGDSSANTNAEARKGPVVRAMDALIAEAANELK